MKYVGCAVIILASYWEVFFLVIYQIFSRFYSVTVVNTLRHFSFTSQFLVENPAPFRWYVRRRVKV
jgi:hypothetical protein